MCYIKDMQQGAANKYGAEKFIWLIMIFIQMNLDGQ